MSAAGPEKPFKLHVSDADIETLHKKLELARFPDELDDAGWQYGAPLAHVKRLVEHWQNGFDWRKSEEEINKLPQFTRDIPVEGFGTLNIHYVHQTSAQENAIPLLFVHGWPGHFLEVRKILPLLTAPSSPDQPSFHVVALSLPGFGFSENPKQKGFAWRQYAEVANKLMISLGYNEYVVQGGDWGHYIAGYLSTYYAHTHVKGWLSNYTNAMPPTFTKFPWLYLTHLITPYTRKEKDGWANTQKSDSPVGLLAWIYEKLVIWTDSYPWEDDEVLEWVSIYWFSRAGPAASLRIYKEMTHHYTKLAVAGVEWTSIPLGFSKFPKELTKVPGK
ncbi:alpha/beta-hydrolase [Cerioporus squamosus]|nr:alpha/beta-hydrolase [Cerioporus squamosus]